MDRLRTELADYYSQYRSDGWSPPDENLAIRREILAAMDAYAEANPDEHPSLLKARLHEEMAERFDPVIFPHSPFFYEMGLRFAENWGTPDAPERVVGSWLYQRPRPGTVASKEREYIRALSYQNPDVPANLWGIWNGFDVDHHCLGYSKLLQGGVNGLLAEIEARQSDDLTPHQHANLQAMARSARAVLRVAERFAEKAQAMLQIEGDPQARRFLTMIAATARRTPAEPPRTFYEGLAMLWLLREVTATLEAIGVSVVGHIDRQLYPLYQADLAAGRITEAEARDLLARWMLPTDIKFHVENNPWPESSTCMELGGCDADGRLVWNDLTRMIIEVHREHKLFSPKLNCRFGAGSPQEYLDLISDCILSGHNHFALLNDDLLIPALVRAGKTEREARLYVNGGCQETIAEGTEHSAGAYYYFNLARVLDLCLRPEERLPENLPAPVQDALPKAVDAPQSFEEFYLHFLKEAKRAIGTGARWAVALGRDHWQVHPCPFLSATLDGCLSTGKDYTQGGAKYNNSGLALCGLGTIVDSLHALRVAVFEEKWLSFGEMQKVLAGDWRGREELRARIRRLPRFGHGNERVDVLTQRVAKDLAAFVRTMPSERGGTFQGSFFVYYAFRWFAGNTRATPDGRKSGDLLTQGIAPDRTTAPKSLTDIFHTLSHVDFRDFPGNCVLDVQLPTGSRFPKDALTATIRAFGNVGGPTLQLNAVSVDDLRAAQREPGNHRDLAVRISGLSARFVCLEEYVQNEIISRALMAAGA